MEKLFSYGTLQYEEVQLATFKRLLQRKTDVLCGYRLEDLQITDPQVIQLSGKAVHQILVASGNMDDQVKGMIFELSKAELRQADEYEVDDYVRIAVNLASGLQAWVYAHRSTLA
ncbi:MAG: gamma-glutamylcyclotransferase [Candidatus Paracaedibacteraceae bacterium]|nr:gamma-glutamylcyclotransferase [Candidatus Paracaedibacteraceae bacterium]